MPRKTPPMMASGESFSACISHFKATASGSLMDAASKGMFKAISPSWTGGCNGKCARRGPSGVWMSFNSCGMVMP